MQLADTPSPQSATPALHPVAVATTYFSLLLAQGCLQWTGCESNPQPLGYESDTLPLRHCTHHVRRIWSDLVQVQTTMFQFRGGYACCASHCRFSCCRSIYLGIIVGLIVFVITDICVDTKRLTSFAGMMLLLLLGFLTSNNPSKVSQVHFTSPDTSSLLTYPHFFTSVNHATHCSRRLIHIHSRCPL